jgi:purine-binding chemotaxis protein CheW
MAKNFATEETWYQAQRRGRAQEWQREVLAIRLATEEYAIDILRIREILKLRPITEVPRAPAFIPGIVSVRGQVIPVMDLRMRIHMPLEPLGKDSRILIVHKDAEVHGLIVDAVRQVVRMRDEDVEPPPAMIGGSGSEFIGGIGRPRPDRMLILLDLDAVLSYQVTTTIRRKP